MPSASGRRGWPSVLPSHPPRAPTVRLLPSRAERAAARGTLPHQLPSADSSTPENRPTPSLSADRPATPTRLHKRSARRTGRTSSGTSKRILPRADPAADPPERARPSASLARHNPVRRSEVHQTPSPVGEVASSPGPGPEGPPARSAQEPTVQPAAPDHRLPPAADGDSSTSSRKTSRARSRPADDRLPATDQPNPSSVPGPAEP